MVINSNMSAQQGARLLGESQALLSRSLARLSSGSKITSPEDDAAGLAVSMRFDAQTNRISAAKSNLNNAISFNQTQDGYLKKVASALDRMSELSMLAQDATKTDSDRALYDAEYQKLGAFINDLATKSFNSVTLFSSTGITVTTDSDAKTLALNAVDLGGATYTAATSTSISTAAAAKTALDNVKAAITQLTSDRSNIGANISVMKSYVDQLSVLRDNLTTANSRLKDVDVAEESTEYARFSILVQAGTAMLAQANQAPQSVMRLIQQ